MNNKIRNIEQRSYQPALKGLKVYEITAYSGGAIVGHQRKDLFKICLCWSNNMICYPDRTFVNSGDRLFFGSPDTLFDLHLLHGTHHGYACVFSADFLGIDEALLQQLRIFKMGGVPILSVDGAQKEALAALFRKMLLEQTGDCAFKVDTIRSCIHAILHVARKALPGDPLF